MHSYSKAKPEINGSRIGRRPDRRWRLRGWTVAAACLCLAGAATASEPRDESQRWVPSFSLYFDALGQKFEGSVTTGDVLGPPLPDGCLFNGPTGNRVPPNGQCPSGRGEIDPSDAIKILPDDEGNDTSVVPLVGTSIELMSPSPFDGWLRPRLFVHGDFAYAFSFERSVAGVESPDAFSLPPGIFLGPTADPEAQQLDELAIFGQGSRARMQVRRFVWSAGGGVALSLDVFGRRIRLKPSFEYLQQELDLIGVVHRAVKLQHPRVSVTSLRHFRQLILTHEEKKTYHGIGPGLELEVDSSRLGPFQSSVYMMGRGYYLLGDLKTTFSQSNEFGETATWSFEPQRWVWRAGVGIRFRWLPETD